MLPLDTPETPQLAVDPPRWRRARRLLWAASALQLIVVGIAGGVLWGLGDVWWVATVALYSPRWILGLPLFLLVPSALLIERRALGVLALAAVALAGPVMGFRVPVARILARASQGGPPPDLRVMTYNVGGGDVPTDALVRYIGEVRPDVVVLTERYAPVDAPEFSCHCDYGLCFLSRFPIRAIDARDRKEFWPSYGSGAIIRYDLETPRGVVQVEQVHLATVRHGLVNVMHRAWRGAPELEANTRLRDWESREARAWTARGNAPLVVMGDFNLPVESAVYQRHWGSLTNAFSLAGFGFGVTKQTKWHGIRIDHVVVGPEWNVDRAWVGPGLGGDHRPMLAELRLKPR